MTIFGNQSFDELVASINRTTEVPEEKENQTTEMVDESQQRTESYRVDTNVFEKDGQQGNSQLGLTASQKKDTSSTENPFFGTTPTQSTGSNSSNVISQETNPFFGTVAKSTQTSATTQLTQTSATTQSSQTNPFFGQTSTTTSTSTSNTDTSTEEPKNTAKVWTPTGSTQTTSTSSTSAIKKEDTTTNNTQVESNKPTDVRKELTSTIADPMGLDAKTIDAIAEAVVDKLQARLSK